MYIKRNYGFWMTFKWSGKPFLLGLIYAFIISYLAYLLGFELQIALATFKCDWYSCGFLFRI